MTGMGTYEPDWRGWLLITEVTVEDAVALTLNVNPDKRVDWEEHASAAQRSEFARRVYWLNKWPFRHTRFVREPLRGCVDAGGFGSLALVEIRKFHLPEVVHFAKKAGWEVPAPLRRLDEEENGGRPKAPLAMLKDDDETDRPPKLSNTAWKRFEIARGFNPRFASTHGGISNAARRIAKTENAGFEAVRRDLSRVLKAQRDQRVQK
jgi:hypothetical protein